jgi:glycosyltransferase involved in cell wall biosynthesis
VTTISIVIPAYNERDTIVELLTKVRSQEVEGVSFEVIVVDDGSKDGTVELLAENPALYDRLIRRSANGGKGAAVIDALKVATGDYVLFQDADLEYDPAEYAVLARPVLEMGAEVVMGSRLIAPRFVRVHYFWNKVGNRLITLLFNMLNNTTFTDIYSCYLLYRRDLVDPLRLKHNGWDQQAEILGLAIRRAEVSYEVPISYYGRTYEEGKKIRPHHALGVFLTIVTTRFRSSLPLPDSAPMAPPRWSFRRSPGRD